MLDKTEDVGHFGSLDFEWEENDLSLQFRRGGDGAGQCILLAGGHVI